MKKILFLSILSMPYSAFCTMEEVEIPVGDVGKMIYVQEPLIATKEKLEPECKQDEDDSFNEKASYYDSENSLSSSLKIGGKAVTYAGNIAGYFLYRPDQNEDLKSVEDMISQSNTNRVYRLKDSYHQDRRILTNKIYVSVKDHVTSDTFKNALPGNFKVEDLGYGEFYLTCESGNPLKALKDLKEDEKVKQLIETVEPDFAVPMNRYP